MKKVLFLLVAAALVTAPATSFAMYPMPYLGTDVDANVIVNTNNATVSNDVEVEAETGDNSISGNSGDVTLRTGNAQAYAFTSNAVNHNTNVILDDCGCDNYMTRRRGLDVDANVIVNTNNATVSNDVEVEAETGDNSISGNGGTYSKDWNSSSSEYSRWNRYERSHGHGWFFGHGHSASGASSASGSTTAAGGHVSYPMGGDVTVRTGNAGAQADTINAVNVNTNTIVRGSYAL